MGPERAIARVRSADGRPVGLAFVVGPRTLVTCAHVVNVALGRQLRESAAPAEMPLLLEFPFGGGRDDRPVRHATVVAWLPATGSFDRHDVAALRLAEALPSGIAALRLAEAEVSCPVQMWGPSPDRPTSGHVSGRLMGAVEKGRHQIDQERRGVYRVVPGFSGGPVWKQGTRQVVGLLQASSVDDEATDAYVLGVDVIAEAVRTAGGPDPATAATVATGAADVGTAQASAQRLAAITILHLSEMRSGAHRAFGGRGFTDADREHDSLAARLLADLEHLKTEHGLVPDLVVATGDLADTAKPAEYQAVHAFLAALRDGLRLGTDRIVVVPGSLDVNRKKCAAYFLDREAEDAEPLPPYWPKWEPFAEMFSRFYGVAFPKDQPWTYLEIPELRVAVAGLNSTMADSHRDDGRHAWLGEAQLRWFADRMDAARSRGWLRVGVLSHSPVRGTSDDNAHLWDADRFGELLAPRLNAVLHGRAHDVGLHHFGPSALPIVGSGSINPRPAALPSAGEAARLVEAPSQYQLVEVHADRLRVWVRRYVPGRRIWVGDTSVSEDGDTWWRDVPTRHVDVDATFPSQEPLRGTGHRRDRFHDRGRGGVPGRHADDLLGRVAEVCRLRLPAALVTEIPAAGPAPGYVRVSAPQSIDSDRPAAVEEYPIGVLTGTATREDVERFLTVDAHFRVGGSAPASKLVYDGPPASEELCQSAHRHGIELLSFVEYQVGFDLRPYAKRQAEELSRDQVYPSELYVSQRYTEIGDDGRPRREGPPESDLLEWLRNRLADPAGHLVVVLGPFGHGKTFLLRELARRMHAGGDPAVPVLVHLRHLEKSHDLDELVAAQLTRGGAGRIDLPLFRYLLREGRVALLFDGFDELAVRVSYDRAAAHLDMIIRAATGRAKVVLTSRDHYFRTEAEVLSVLGGRLAAATGRRLVTLADFNDDQVLAFLTNRMGDSGRARERSLLLRDVKDLLGLSRNPRMLHFIAGLDEEQLYAARDRTGTITAAELYRVLVARWLRYEWERLNQRGSVPVPSEDVLRRAITDLALRLWRSTGACQNSCVILYFV